MVINSQTGDPAESLRGLGARFALSGSVRRSVDRLRIFAELSETEGSVVLWNSRFEGEFADFDELLDDVAERQSIVKAAVAENRALPPNYCVTSSGPISQVGRAVDRIGT